MSSRAMLLLLAALAAQPAVAPALAQDAGPSAGSSAQGAATGEARSAPEGFYRIAGTVVSAANGQPLQHAEVQIRTSESRSAYRTATSDELGRFAFTGVPAGTFSLQGSAPHYLTSSYDEHDGFNTGIVTGAGLDTESLVLRLRPEGIVSGTILDESAEPVENARVRLVRESHATGEGRYVTAGQAGTDDLGHFELPRLAPGTYYLAVTANPWYAVHPVAQPQPRGSPFGFVDSVDPSLDVAYPTTYYPGATDPSAAAPIVIHGGDEVDVSLQLSPEPAVTLTLPRAPGTPLPGVPIQRSASGEQPLSPPPPVQIPPQLRAMVFGQLEPVMGTQMRQTGSETIISGVAPGDYYLADARTPFGQPGDATPIHLMDRNTDAALPASAGRARVHVQVQSQDGGAAPKGVSIGLRRNGAQLVPFRPLDDKGKAEIDVPPGDYYFVVSGPRRYYVAQVHAEDKPLDGNNIHVAAGDNTSYTVAVTAGTHSIKAVATKDGKPFAGAFILMFPAGEARAIHTDFRQQSDLDGSFDLRDLPPGDYVLLAIDGGWDVNWRDPAVLARYLPASVAVHIAGDGPKTRTLDSPVPVQPAGGSERPAAPGAANPQPPASTSFD